MTAAGGGPQPASVAELREQIEAERTGLPFLAYRDADGVRHVRALTGDRVTVGRHEAADVALDWDEKVSRVHAELEPLAASWVLADDGLSRNGSFLNGERVSGRARLRDGDTLRFGSTQVAFHHPGGGESRATAMASVMRPVPQLSPAQRNVLAALCRPYQDGAGFASPASNQQIAGELFLSVDAVKAHLRVLFEKFGLADAPQSEKRVRLVEAAFGGGLVSDRTP